MLILKTEKNMGILRTAIIGAAVYAGVKYITKKDPITGQSIVDELLDRAPEWADKAKGYTEDLKSRVSNAAEDLAR
ncbi:YtxH domain-containing protein [Pedobacter sp. PF22-3]|uniref:YtxH domain-containing protein n=1 Tax=Pedobacter sp. PF22-3 TaxID=2994467 RepID=UPI0022457CE7|nr:YtxH domain-containing protein [Pedobacter sp. PF22-3]MCX2492166.1 YtxH domain-containing protein [Pedobacter sp. PF22-3]